MAHIGVLWRLHFRRDLGIDLTNNKFGYAHTYLMGCANVNGIVGGPLSGMVVSCPAVDEKTFLGAKWTSDPVIANGHQVVYEMESSSSTGYPDVACRLTVRDLAAGILVVLDAPRRVGLPFSPLTFTIRTVPPTHPALLSMGAGSASFFEAVAETWA